MATRLEIAQLLADDRATEPGSVVLSQDRARSLSSSFVRAIRNGRPTMGVGSDIGTSAAAAALVHLVSWQLPIDNLSNGVTLLLDESRAEVVDGARTLRFSLPPSLQGAVQIAVLKDGKEQTVDVAEGAPDFTHSKGAERWKLLLDKWRVANPPSLAQLLMEKVDSPSVRLYPMLSGNPRTGHWSMRIDGLEVGRVSSSKSYLDVGHTSAAGHVSPTRGKWLGVNPSRRFAFDESTLDSATRLLQSLITSFESSDGALDHGQPEHALESRVLRGLVPVRTDGSTLDVWLEDGLVSRGSQFPTLWTERGRPKYLDALLQTRLYALGGRAEGAQERRVRVVLPARTCSGSALSTLHPGARCRSTLGLPSKALCRSNAACRRGISEVHWDKRSLRSQSRASKGAGKPVQRRSH